MKTNTYFQNALIATDINDNQTLLRLCIFDDGKELYIPDYFIKLAESNSELANKITSIRIQNLGKKLSIINTGIKVC